MIQYAQSKGWGYKETGDQIILDNCPYCGKSDHFYAAVTGTKDGLHECKKCSQSGNLYELMKSQGDRDPNFQSQKDWAGNSDKTEELPNVDRCHEALMQDQDALDFLMSTRGFDLKVIQEQKIGLTPNRYFRNLNKETKAIVIPYLKDGRPVFAKYRSFPPDAKSFSAPTGWDVPLYNEQTITEETKEIIFVEGEYDALSCLSNKVKDVVGVPGADIKKTLWVDLVAHVEKKYILYDNDKKGEKGAQALAEKLGLDSCYRVVIPPFTFIDDEGNEKSGKDINDWFKHGGGDLEKFQALLKAARKFDVKGVKSLGESLDELEAEYEGKEKDEAKYITQWDSLNYKIGGFEDGDVIDLIAGGKVGKSTVALNMIDDLVARYNEPGVFICGEMTQARLARKWLSMITQTDDSPAKSEQDKIDKVKRIREAIPLAKSILRSREADLYLAYPQIRELEELYEMMYQAKRRYGVKFMVLDNLQLFCDRTLKNDAHRTIHMSKLSKQVMSINKELGTVLFRIIQPRGLKDDKIADGNDADGSSQILKDCDLSIGLHRNKKANITARDFEAMGNYIDEEDALEPQMLFNVGHSRYSPGGKVVLEFDGATSSVREMPKDKSRIVTQSTTYKSGEMPSESFAKIMTGAIISAAKHEAEQVTI
jgi:replicative DNA helicase